MASEIIHIFVNQSFQRKITAPIPIRPVWLVQTSLYSPSSVIIGACAGDEGNIQAESGDGPDQPEKP